MIRILKPSLDDAQFEGNPVLRGVICNDDLKKLRIDEQYQREFLAKGTRRNIFNALLTKERLPDLELGMRGERWSVDDNVHEMVTLLDPVFIIDGQQRRGSIVEYLHRFPESAVRQGAIVHFNTNMEWEKSRFQALNLYRNKVATPILIRNLRNQHPGIATLYGLCASDREFVLFDRVSWQQTPSSSHLLTATALLTYTLHLHSHLASTRSAAINLAAMATDRVVARIGLPMYRQNIMNYWMMIDSIWGVKNVSQRSNVWFKSGFQRSLINVFSRHLDFWKNDIEFCIPYDIRKKLKLLNINDPEIVRLGSSAGIAVLSLEQILIRWINSGKRSGRLRSRTIDDEIEANSAYNEEEQPLPMAAKSK